MSFCKIIKEKLHDRYKKAIHACERTRTEIRKKARTMERTSVGIDTIRFVYLDEISGKVQTHNDSLVADLSAKFCPLWQVFYI
jgi:hypothetical protein